MRRQTILLISFNFLIGIGLMACAGIPGPPGGGIPICPNEPLRCPDLTPVVIMTQAELDADKECLLCKQVEVDGKTALEISVKNRGGIGFYKEPDPPPGTVPLGNPDAPASTTRIVFSTVSSPDTVVELPTPELKVGFSVTLEPIVLPPQCATQDCNVAVTVDAEEVVTESRENNNRFTCFLPVVL